MIRKAIIPMAGLGLRLYPISTILPKGLMPFVLQDGTLVTALQLLAETLLRSKTIQQIGIVVSPEAIPLYEQFLSGGGEKYASACPRNPTVRQPHEALHQIAEHLVLIPQPRPYGLGHAIWCARDFAEGEAVLVVLGDHIYLNPAEANPVNIALDSFQSLGGNSPLYTVHRIPSTEVSKYGILKGEPIEGVAPYRLYRVVDIVEKPTPEYALAHLNTPEVPKGQFLAHHGLFAFPSAVWQAQESLAECYTHDQGEWMIVDTQHALLRQMPAYMVEMEASSLDFGTAEGYRETFKALSRFRREPFG